MDIILTKKITCENSVSGMENCASIIKQKIEDEFNCKLMFTKKDDGSFTETNGSLTIQHLDGDHKIRLTLWDKTEKANNIHPDPRKKLAIIPSESEIKKLLKVI